MKTGEPIDPEWTKIHWPHYWHYDSFHGLGAVAMAGKLADPRAKDALDLLRSQHRPDGTWAANGRRHWRKQGSTGVEVVDWGDGHQMVTPIAKKLLS